MYKNLDAALKEVDFEIEEMRDALRDPKFMLNDVEIEKILNVFDHNIQSLPENLYTALVTNQELPTDENEKLWEILFEDGLEEYSGVLIEFWMCG